MNVPFVTFQCRDLKVFQVVYFYRQIVIFRLGKIFFHAVFYILCISSRSIKINLLEFCTLQTPLPPVALK